MSSSRKHQFTTVYNATHGRLYNTFLKLTRDEAMVKDILQQCYIRLWENWDNIGDRSDLYPLLFTYARNIFIDELRKIKTQRALQETAAEPEEEITSHEHYVMKESIASLKMAVEEMPARRKEVFRLAVEEGLSRKNIAERLSLSPNTIDCHLQEAMKTLRGIIRNS